MKLTGVDETPLPAAARDGNVRKKIVRRSAKAPKSARRQQLSLTAAPMLVVLLQTSVHSYNYRHYNNLALAALWAAGLEASALHVGVFSPVVPEMSPGLFKDVSNLSVSFYDSEETLRDAIASFLEQHAGDKDLLLYVTGHSAKLYGLKLFYQEFTRLSFLDGLLYGINSFCMIVDSCYSQLIAERFLGKQTPRHALLVASARSTEESLAADMDWKGVYTTSEFARCFFTHELTKTLVRDFFSGDGSEKRTAPARNGSIPGTRVDFGKICPGLSSHPFIATW